MTTTEVPTSTLPSFSGPTYPRGAPPRTAGEDLATIGRPYPAPHWRSSGGCGCSRERLCTPSPDRGPTIMSPLNIGLSPLHGSAVHTWPATRLALVVKQSRSSRNAHCRRLHVAQRLAPMCFYETRRHHLFNSTWGLLITSNFVNVGSWFKFIPFWGPGQRRAVRRAGPLRRLVYIWWLWGACLNRCSGPPSC